MHTTWVEVFEYSHNSRVSFPTSEILKKPKQAQDLLLSGCRIKQNNVGICELQYFMLTLLLLNDLIELVPFVLLLQLKLNQSCLI